MEEGGIFMKCFVTNCKNSTSKTPSKIFAHVQVSLAKRWCQELGKRYTPNKTIYCCQDHLDLEQDFENYLYWKIMNGRPILKPNAKLRLNENTKSNIHDVSIVLCQDAPSTWTEAKGKVLKSFLNPCRNIPTHTKQETSNNPTGYTSTMGVDQREESPYREELISRFLNHCKVCSKDIEIENEFQFVCLQCDDVHVCKACFDDGQHAHHYMLRIPKDKPPDEVSRVVSRLRTELTTETASQEEAVPQVKQAVPHVEQEEQDMAEQEHNKLEQEQAVPEQEQTAQPSSSCPVDKEKVNKKIELDKNPDLITVQGDTDYHITTKEELVEDEIDRRRVEPCVEQVVGRTHTTTATHSHTKRAPSGDSEAGPSKVARSTGTGPHYTSTGGRHHTTDTREKPSSSNVRLVFPARLQNSKNNEECNNYTSTKQKGRRKKGA